MNPIHLWEPAHPYYGPEAFGEARTMWPSWAAYSESMSKADIDMNLVWRWDWHARDDDGSDSADRSAPGTEIRLFMCHQRKGRFVEHVVTVTPDDEMAVYAYLARHWATVQSLWAPFTADASPNAAEMVAQMRARRIAALKAELSILEPE